MQLETITRVSKSFFRVGVKRGMRNGMEHGMERGMERGMTVGEPT